MKMQTTVTVVGMKSSKGKMDNGQEFDSTKAFCLTDLDARKGTAKGQGVAESGHEKLRPALSTFHGAVAVQAFQQAKYTCHAQA